VDDLFGSSPESIPVYWQWVALVLGFIGMVGTFFGALALTLLLKTQPEITVEFHNARSGNEQLLIFDVKNEPIAARSLAGRLRVRRAGTTATIYYLVGPPKSDLAFGIGADYAELPAEHQEHSVTVVRMSPTETGHVARQELRSNEQDLLLEPGNYQCRVTVQEGDYGHRFQREFLVTVDSVRWLA
jgi:hypothetical protein